MGTSNLFRNIRGRHNAFNDIHATGGTVTLLEQAQHTTFKNATISKSAIQDAGRYTQLINLSSPVGKEIHYTLGNTRTYGTPSTTNLLGSIKISASDEDGVTTIPTNTTPNYYLRCNAEGNAYWSILEPDLDARAWDQSATNNIKMDAFAITNNLNCSNGLFFNANGNVKIGSTVPNISDGNLQVDGNLAFRIYNNHGTILTNDDTWDNNFVVKNGKTIIGNSTENYLDQVATFDETYKLFVNGKMRIKEELRINQTALPWPDYVFASDYKLMPLEEIEQHIKDKGHLPNMPNAAEVEQTGVPLATMITKQHEKIEELTLHLIELQKDIDTLKQKQKK